LVDKKVVSMVYDKVDLKVFSWVAQTVAWKGFRMAE